MVSPQADVLDAIPRGGSMWDVLGIEDERVPSFPDIPKNSRDNGEQGAVLPEGSPGVLNGVR